MRCPACGYEEKAGSTCSKCHAPLPVKTEKPVRRPSSIVPPRPPAPLPPSAEPPKEKYRRRPLMDLDLTIPELEVEEEKKPDESKTDKKP